MMRQSIRAQPMAGLVKARLSTAARRLGAQDPVPVLGGAMDEAFSLPVGDDRYAKNALTPGAAPLEPSFSETEPNGLRFTMDPLGPEAPPAMKRNETTRLSRSIIGPAFGRDALRWFDAVTEDWRGLSGAGGLRFGGWFGSAFDRDGIYASKAYYELRPDQIDSLPPQLANIANLAMQAWPALVPIFTSIACRAQEGRQRVTFYHDGPLNVATMGPLLDALGLTGQLPQIMRIVGLALGGAFEAPPGSVLIGLAHTRHGPELKLELLLTAIEGLPDSFMELIRLGMAERPRHLRALDRWVDAYTPDDAELPGDFSVLSIRVLPEQPARVSLYLRPLGFEIAAAQADAA